MQSKPCDMPRLFSNGLAKKISIVVDAPITLFQKSVDRSIQTAVSCLFNPDNRLRNTFVSQEEYFKVCSESKMKSLKHS